MFDPNLTVEDAYLKLKLTPLDEFIRMREGARNAPSRSNPIGQHAGIGATTWMCVSAAVHICKGHEIAIYETNLLLASSIRTAITKAVFVLSGENPVTDIDRIIEWDNGACLRVRPESSPRGIPLSDRVFKERAIRRAAGPFAMTREIRCEGGHFYAYAEDDEMLLELPEATVVEVLEKYPEVTLHGARIEDPTPGDGFIKEDRRVVAA